MNCCKHKYFVIYRGDDTDFPGNQELIVELNTERDLTGCSAHFSFQGFTQDFDEIPADKKLHLIIPSSATSNFALGAADAKLWLTNGTKVRTVENRIHIVVTNRVDEAYNNDDPQAITVTISGGGGGATVVLDDTVTEESPNGVKSSGIWSWVKSLLPSWLTAESEEPRGKTELRVFEAPYSAWVIEGEHLPDNLTIGRYADYHPEYPVDGFAPVIDGNTVGLVKGNSESVNLSWDDKEWSGGVPLSATRTKLPIVPVSPPQKLTRTANLTAGGLAKFGADGVLEKATEGVDYLKTHQDISGKQDKILETGVLKGGGAGAILLAIPSSSAGELADYRDPTDNVCHKTTSVAGEWSTVTKDGDVWSVYRQDTPGLSVWVLRRNGENYRNAGTMYVEDDTATSLTWVGRVDWDKDFDITFTRTFTTLASKGHTFVTEDNVHSKGVREDGSPADQELHDFFQESNSALNGRLSYVRNTTATLKDRAFNALTFDGTEFNLSTALSAVAPTASGQPRDLLIVATATAATTISYTACAIKGDKPTIDGAGTWLITLTEYESDTWYCRQIKMEDAA